MIDIEKTTRDRGVERIGLGHPVWWICLAMMLVNDHLLKGSGWTPAWLTGKLSDFSGLVVLALLLAAAARSILGKAAAFAISGLFLASINIFPEASEAIESFASNAGFSIRLWPDPTDLIALVVLPIAWIFVPKEGREIYRPMQQTALSLGILGCMATSEYHSPAIFILNHSGESIDFVIWDLEQPRVCPQSSISAPEPTQADVPVRDEFVNRLDVSLEFEQYHILMFDPAYELRNKCGVVLVKIDGGPEKILVWNKLGYTPGDISEDQDKRRLSVLDTPPAGAIVITRKNGKLGLESWGPAVVFDP